MSTTRVYSALLDGVVSASAAVGAKEIIYRVVEVGIKECVKDSHYSQIIINSVIASLFFVGGSIYAYKKGVGYFSSPEPEDQAQLLINDDRPNLSY